MIAEDFYGMMDRLCSIAIAECPKCAMGLEPQLIKGYWRHDHDLCLSPGSHERMDSLESEWAHAKLNRVLPRE